MKGILKMFSKMSKEKSVQCGYCPSLIFKRNEQFKRIHYLEKKPVCVKCRVLKNSEMAARIKADKYKFDAHIEKLREKEQEEANKMAIRIAVKSQENIKNLK